MGKPWKTVRVVVEVRSRADGMSEKDLVWAVRNALETNTTLMPRIINQYGVRIGARFEVKEFNRVVRYHIDEVQNV